MINLNGTKMTKKEVVKQIKKRFKEYTTYGQLNEYEIWESKTADFTETLCIDMCRKNSDIGVMVYIKTDSIVINIDTKDSMLEYIVNAIIWDNRDGITEVKTHITEIYKPGENIDYYIRDQETLDRIAEANNERTK